MNTPFLLHQFHLLFLVFKITASNGCLLQMHARCELKHTLQLRSLKDLCCHRMNQERAAARSPFAKVFVDCFEHHTVDSRQPAEISQKEHEGDKPIVRISHAVAICIGDLMKKCKDMNLWCMDARRQKLLWNMYDLWQEVLTSWKHKGEKLETKTQNFVCLKTYCPNVIARKTSNDIQCLTCKTERSNEHCIYTALLCGGEIPFWMSQNMCPHSRGWLHIPKTKPAQESQPTPWGIVSK